MPVPTDTFWNIRRLNRVFAISAILLLATFAWAIIQDYDKTWRQPQRNGKVWQAALVEQKLRGYDSPEKRAQLAALNQQIGDTQAALDAHDVEIGKLNEKIKQQTSDQANLEFRLNTLKANVTVSETQLQNAITAGDDEERKRLETALNRPDARPQLVTWTADLARMKDDSQRTKQDLKERNARVIELQKQRTAATEMRESLAKKRESLQPQNPIAKLSGMIRAAPLLQFMNPAEKVAQTIVSDVQTDLGGFKKVETLDRCTTCHVNIANKEFTREKIQAYLEEQVATGRAYRYAIPDPNRPASLAAATSEKPGASAVPEFWHAWGRKLLAADSYAKTNAQVKILLAAVGKVKVTIDGKDLAAADVKYDGNPTTRQSVADADQSAQRQQDRILVETINALMRADPADRSLTQARNIAMQYPQRLQTMLKAELPIEEFKELENRYRYALIAVVNGMRKDEGLAALDPSPVMLAHPRLDLYADADSKHPMESSEGKIGVGCTSCHDGSGEETDFVVAAHTARSIWVDSKTGEPVLPAQLTPKAAAEQPQEHFAMASMLAAVYPEGSVMPANVSAMHIEPPPAETTQDELAAPTEKSPPTPYIDPVTGKRGEALPQLGYWIKRYEPEAPRPFELVYHEWDRPMLPPKYLQANCVRCHTEAYDVRDTAPIVYEGRALFTRLGCVNCHQMDSIAAEQNRKVGPDLRHVTAKLSPAFINTWVWAPKAFRPTTKMPHFFLLENNASDEEIRRTRQETRAITEYLVRTAEPLPPKYIVQPSYKGSSEAGHALFTAVGCLGCHNNLGDTTSETRSQTDGVKRPVTVGEKWITQDLIKSGKLARELRAKNGGKEPTSKDLTTEAARIYDAMTYNERQMYVMENLEQPSNGVSTGNYPDGSPKPIFIHHGPELSGVGTKLTAGRSEAEARQWLFDWLKEPRHYSDYTVMPRLRLSDQQAMDLAEYLLSQKRTNDKPDDPWQAVEVQPDDAKLRDMVTLFLKSRYNNSADIAYQKAIDDHELTAYATDALTTRTVDAKAAAEQVKSMSLQEKQLVFLGKKLIAHYGCMSCHAINGTESISSPCANLSDWGQKQVGKLDFGYLEPEKIESHEVKDVIAVPMVNGLCERVCTLNGETTGISKPIDLAWPDLDFARTSWAQQKLKNTRIWDRGRALLEPQPKSENLEARLGKPYDKLRMPTFYLNDEQVHDLVTFLISNRDRLVSERLTRRTEHDAAVKIARGRELTERYNCVGCHQIENGTMAPPNVAQVQQWYPQDLLVDKAPPSLRGEGNKVQFAWLFNFFKAPEPMRPLLQPAGGIRMPSFPATDAEWTAIIDYFNSISLKESNELRQQLDPVVKYIATANKAEQLKRSSATQPATQPAPQIVDLAGGLVWYNHPDIPPSERWPGDDWVDQPTFAAAVAALQQWSIEKRQMTPVDFDVTKNSAKDLARSYRTALYKALFTSDLYQSPYPFVDAPKPDTNDRAFADRLAKGQALFHEMQCLSCHYLGDPSAAGAVKEPKGPNLSLVHERLQRRWVRRWVQEPPVIQVGTKMPQFFSGLSALKIDGQDWATAQALPAAEIKRTHDAYGATADEQAGLVLDYLYAAGEMRTTDVQPPKPATGGATTKPAK